MYVCLLWAPLIQFIRFLFIFHVLITYLKNLLKNIQIYVTRTFLLAILILKFV